MRVRVEDYISNAMWVNVERVMSAGNNVIGEVAAAMVGTQDFIFTIIISSCNADFE